MKFAANGTLYRGSKPVMWSVVEKTALAEAEVEYEDHVSDTVYVAFPVCIATDARVMSAMPSEWRCFGRVDRHLDDDAVDDSRQSRDLLFVENRLWPLSSHRARRKTIGQRSARAYILADTLAEECLQGREGRELCDASRMFRADALAGITCCSSARRNDPRLRFPRSPLRRRSCHRRHRHGLRPYRAGPWPRRLRHLDGEQPRLAERGIDTRIPYTVDADGFFTEEAPGFDGRRVIDDKGNKGDANEAVIKALIEAGNLVARGKLKHQYPHSWRSKKPLIFRNTPQWFIALDKPIGTPKPSP